MPQLFGSETESVGRWRVVQRRLGRGLDFLISGAPGTTAEEELQQLGLVEIRPNPFQPRREFPDEDLAELAASIAEHGVLQPVIVRATAEGYELVAGERRCEQESVAVQAVQVQGATASAKARQVVRECGSCIDANLENLRFAERRMQRICGT